MKRSWKPFVDRRRVMENTPDKSVVPYSKGSSACLLAVLLFLAAAAAAKADEPKFKEPRTMYLAMGDSLAFGFQEAKLLAGLPNPSPSLFNTGYVDDFAADFGATYPGVETVNLGCPGETTDTLISATNATTGCATYSYDIHVDHPGTTQLQAALSVLLANPGKTVPITIDIGGNDVLATVRGCTTSSGFDLACISAAAPATFAHIQENLANVLSQLREGAAYSEIIVVGLYDVLYPAIFQQTVAQTGSLVAAAAAGAQADALVAQLNSLMASTAASYRAFFADPLSTFNPPGNPTVEIATICTLTAVCGPLQDIHPTDAGYMALGNVVLAASEY